MRERDVDAGTFTSEEDSGSAGIGSEDLMEEALEEEFLEEEQIDDIRVLDIISESQILIWNVNRMEIVEHVDEKYINEYKERLRHAYKINSNNNYKDLTIEKEKIEELYKGTTLNLHDYQVEGVNWLLSNFLNRKNVILGDEMGVGKTIQVISTFNYLMKELNIPGPFLLIVPLSVLSNWLDELDKWKIKYINIVCYQGNSDRKRALQKYDFFYKENYFLPNIVITNKESISKNYFLDKINWKYIVVDEAHFLSNENSKIYKKLKSFGNIPFCLLTGTPIQNNLLQFYSLIRFLGDKTFTKYKLFKNCYDNNIDEFKKFITTRILRRTKDQVLNLLPKQEYILNLEPTPLQNDCYELIEKSLSLENVNDCLKISNHPFLFINRDEFDKSLNTIDNKEYKLNKLIKTSSKFIIMDYLLNKNYKLNNKVLIYSQFIQTLNIIEYYLKLKKYSYQRLDGSTKSNDRRKAIESFKANDFIFLLSTKAGGLGLNLSCASVIIEFDQLWNPATDLQLMDRCHRYGQTKIVEVYKLVINHEIENRIIEFAKTKLKLNKKCIKMNNLNNEQKWKEYNYKKQMLNLTLKNCKLWYEDDHLGLIYKQFKKFPNIDYLIENNDDIINLISIYSSSFIKLILTELMNALKNCENEFRGISISEYDNCKIDQFKMFLDIYNIYQDKEFNNVLRYGCSTKKNELFLYKLTPLYSVDQIKTICEKYSITKFMKKIEELLQNEVMSNKEYLKKLVKIISSIGDIITKQIKMKYHQIQVWTFIEGEVGIDKIQEIYNKKSKH
ncbi:hypothetical protein ABK040_009557 [Willaertia magna]